MIDNLQCDYVDDVNVDFDILVSDNLRRTVKLMLAINKGADILSIRWLIDSDKEKKLLPLKDYILRDEEMEKKLNFSVEEALEKVRKEEQKLFEGKEFYLSKSVVPAYKELRVLIESGGGKVMDNPSKRILNVFNEKKEKKAIEQYKSQGYHLCNAETILESIMQRKFEPTQSDE